MARRKFPAADSSPPVVKANEEAQSRRTASTESQSTAITAAATVFTSHGSAGALSSRTPSPNIPVVVSKKPYVCRATQTTPRFDLLLPGQPVALDIEFQTYLPIGSPKWIQRLGRVALINTQRQTILDVYCYYPNEQGVRKDVPPRRFNVSRADLMKQHGAMHAQTVEKWVAEIVKRRTVVVHDGRGDLTAFQYEKDAFKDSKIVDTQQIGLPPVEDDDATMLLFLKRFPNAFDHEAAQAKVRDECAAAHAGAASDGHAVETTTTGPARADNDRKRFRNCRNNYKRSANLINGAAHRAATDKAKRTTDANDAKGAEGFKLSIEDDAAFPALGAMAPGMSRR
ncbi:hypothetical protein LTR65_010430 [Meristemomyces frigidus]